MRHTVGSALWWPLGSNPCLFEDFSYSMDELWAAYRWLDGPSETSTPCWKHYIGGASCLRAEALVVLLEHTWSVCLDLFEGLHCVLADALHQWMAILSFFALSPFFFVEIGIPGNCHNLSKDGNTDRICLHYRNTSSSRLALSRR